LRGGGRGLSDDVVLLLDEVCDRGELLLPPLEHVALLAQGIHLPLGRPQPGLVLIRQRLDVLLRRLSCLPGQLLISSLSQMLALASLQRTPPPVT